MRNKTLRVSNDVRLSESQDGAVLLDLSGGLYFGINPVGVVVWNKIKDGCNEDKLARSVAEQFQISVDLARTDVLAFLEQLKAKGLILSENPSRIPDARWRRLKSFLSRVRAGGTNGSHVDT